MEFQPQPYWHIHHDRLLEWSFEPIEVRRQAIQTTKPTHEVPTRIRLMQPIEGTLDPHFNAAGVYHARATMASLDIWRRWTQAWNSWPPDDRREVLPGTGRSARYEAKTPAGREACILWNNLGKVLHELEVLRREAWIDIERHSLTQVVNIFSLHQRECINRRGCTWNGSVLAY